MAAYARNDPVGHRDQGAGGAEVREDVGKSRPRETWAEPAPEVVARCDYLPDADGNGPDPRPVQPLPAAGGHAISFCTPKNCHSAGPFSDRKTPECTLIIRRHARSPTCTTPCRRRSTCLGAVVARRPSGGARRCWAGHRAAGRVRIHHGPRRLQEEPSSRQPDACRVHCRRYGRVGLRDSRLAPARVRPRRIRDHGLAGDVRALIRCMTRCATSLRLFSNSVNFFRFSVADKVVDASTRLAWTLICPS